MAESRDAPDALLIWNGDISGASFAIPVDRVSDGKGPSSCVRVGFDDEIGRGYLERRDGSRLVLCEMDPDEFRSALSVDAAVVVEIELGTGMKAEYHVEIEAPALHQSPGF